MYGHESLPSRIYSYGARPPSENADLVREQLRAANRYRNALVEQELRRRQQSLQALLDAFPDAVRLQDDVVRLEAELEEARIALKRQHAIDRRRSATTEQKDQVQSIVVRLREARAVWKARKAECWADPFLVSRLEAVEAEDNTTRKTLRAACGIYWGSYLSVEQCLKDARKGAPPRFKGYRGEGKLAVQLQGGLSVSEALLGTDQRLRIEVVSGTRKKPYAIAWLRVGSEGRAPIWAKVPFVLHRPLPPESQIKWAYLLCCKVGPHEKWSVQFVLSQKEWVREDAALEGMVAVDIGWRRVADGLRVAYWVGDDGAEGELVLSEYDLNGWERADTLRSTRDKAFDAERLRLHAWLTIAEGVPEWLREMTATLHAWKSQRRLAAVAIRWREERFASDEEGFELLEAWRRQDRHLWCWETAQRRGIGAWREDLYCRFAAMLRRRYRTVILEKIDWRHFHRLPKVEQEAPEAAAREWVRNAAPGRLAEILREKMVENQMTKAAFTTQRCHACGEREEFDAKMDLEHVCSHCGNVWDQDANAAKILLSLAQGQLEALPREAR